MRLYIHNTDAARRFIYNHSPRLQSWVAETKRYNRFNGLKYRTTVVVTYVRRRVSAFQRDPAAIREPKLKSFFVANILVVRDISLRIRNYKYPPICNWRSRRASNNSVKPAQLLIRNSDRQTNLPHRLFVLARIHYQITFVPSLKTTLS